MLSYHGDEKIKERVLAQIQGHYAADEIIKGIYWKNGKGCAVGCTIYCNDHHLYEDLFGIPTSLAYLKNSIFESLQYEMGKQWPLRFMSAVAVGKDLSLIPNQFLHWLLVDEKDGVIHLVPKDSAQANAIAQVADLHKQIIEGKIVTQEKWDAARDAAYDVACDAEGDGIWSYACAAWVAKRAADWAIEQDTTRTVTIDNERAARFANSAMWFYASATGLDSHMVFTLIGDKLINLLENL